MSQRAYLVHQQHFATELNNIAAQIYKNECLMALKQLVAYVMQFRFHKSEVKPVFSFVINIFPALHSDTV